MVWPFSRLERKLDLVQSQQQAIVRELQQLKDRVRAVNHDTIRIGDNTMAKIQDVIDRIQQQETMIDGLSTLMQETKQKLDDALSGTTLPASVQAKIDEAFAELDQNSAKLAAALGTAPDGETPAPVGDQGGAADTGSTDTSGQTVDAATGQPVDNGDAA